MCPDDHLCLWRSNIEHTAYPVLTKHVTVATAMNHNFFVWISTLNYSSVHISFDTFHQLDHFDFTNDETFKLRYFISNKYSSVSNPPIFFYTGNEGDIVLFCNNSVSSVYPPHLTNNSVSKEYSPYILTIL